ncbi:MAG: acetylglutamate kinase [Candidatus Omnitrophica bacterium]|nr:acetylglutamate kinase [Candidatus Omnitrophota bacterium]MDD5429570.1 acetylglutamate kinase [Candidatus Omnitrophota bacterium]
MVQEAIKKADVLIEALPYIKKFHKKVFVIKYGGSILSEERVRKCVLEDIAFLRFAGIRPIIVHGGGPNITERLRQYKVTAKFVNGMRVTDEFTLKVVAEELDKLNDLISSEIAEHGVKAIGFKYKDNILKAVKKENEIDLGFVGDVSGFDNAALQRSLEEGVPVVCPMGISNEGKRFNINADDVAFFMASALKAEKLVLLTNVLGVMRNPKDEHSLISTITVDGVQELIDDKIIEEGMVPKVKAAANAIRSGVGKAHIVDAKIPHALLLEIFTDQGVSTEIVK